MNTTTHTTTDAAEIISGVEGVIGANPWEKHGKARVYIDLPKLNGGKAWNGGRACTAWFDVDTNEVVCRADWAGAKTRNYAREVLARVAAALGVEYRESETRGG